MQHTGEEKHLPRRPAAKGARRNNSQEKRYKKMEEKVTMDDYADELEASFCKVQEGDVLTGTVIGISETEGNA